MKKTLFVIIAGLAVIGGVIGGLTACSGSGSSGPPNATSVLQSDGYTYDSALTNAVQTQIGGAQSNAADGLSSIAVGSQGNNFQVIMVFDNAAEASAGASGVGSTPGITMSTSGDVVTATGTGTAFANFGG